MENMAVNARFWSNRRVFLTGHTGFKGTWLSLWLHQLGAQVTGYALEPPTKPSLFELARVGELVDSHIADVRDAECLSRRLSEAGPDIVIHMAAQPLVRDSYRIPTETYATNVMGTVHLLEAVRGCASVKAVVNVTTDKCYENREWIWGYREDEPMGGHDPYSSSKACSELITLAYRSSFFEASNVAVATARAGNVIGGGDWAADRLVPDFLRAIDAGEKLTIRSPQSIRPWQHVLEPLSGYLKLAEHLFTAGSAFSEPWNFGPADNDARSVGWIVECLASMRPDIVWECDTTSQLHEAHYLKLDSSKAHIRMGWQPRWDLKAALAKTMEWHQAWRQSCDMREISLRQIAEYQQDLPQLFSNG